MTRLSQQMKQNAELYIEKIYKDPFIQGIVTGTLPKEVVRHYLEADSHYLSEFANIYALLLAKVVDKKEKQFLFEQIDFVLNQEVDAHVTLANYVGEPYQEIIKNGKWYPAADHYIKHMYYNIYTYGVAETLAAMAPCPWVYRFVAKMINSNHYIPENHPFKAWIDFYDNEWIDELMAVYDEMIDKYTLNATPQQQARIVANFLESCQHERAFFNMAYTLQKWDGQ